MMELHDITKAKVKQLFELGMEFCETQKTNYNEYPDVIFVVNAFKSEFDEYKNRILFRKSFTIEMYLNDIYNFDNIMNSWKEHLVHNLPGDSSKNNDLYSVLFSILEGIVTILEDDHLYWEEDEIDEEVEDLEEETSPIEEDEDEDDIDYEEDYVERTF